jgi:hypothetical protein
MPGAVLRVSGSKAGVTRYLAESRWRPLAVYWKGKPRFQSSTRVSSINGFNLSVSDAPGSRLDLQIRDAKRFLKRERSELARLKRHKLRSVIDFGLHSKEGSVAAFYRFDAELLGILVRAGVELEVSHYGGPATNDG